MKEVAQEKCLSIHLKWKDYILIFGSNPRKNMDNLFFYQISIVQTALRSSGHVYQQRYSPYLE